MVVPVDIKDYTAQKNATINTLGQTAKKCVTQLVKAATNQQEYVTLGVILDGEDSFVKKNV